MIWEIYYKRLGKNRQEEERKVRMLCGSEWTQEMITEEFLRRVKNIEITKVEVGAPRTQQLT